MRKKEKEGRATSRTLWPVETEIIAKAVAKVRKSARMSQRQLSAELGKGKTYISSVERQQQSLDVQAFMRILILCDADAGDTVNKIIAEIKKKT